VASAVDSQYFQTIERIEECCAQHQDAIVFKKRNGIARRHAPRQFLAICELHPKGIFCTSRLEHIAFRNVRESQWLSLR